MTMPLTGVSANFTLTGLSGGAHNLVASYSGDSLNSPSQGTASVTLSPLNLTVTAPTVAISYGSAIPVFASAYSGFVGSDTAATSLAGTPALTTTPAMPVNVGSYPIVSSAGTLTSSSYNFVFVNGLLTINQAATAMTLTSSNTAPGQNLLVTFTAKVTSTGTGTPTGSVSFFSGTTLLNTITLPSSGIATLSTGFANLGSSMISAVYSGDGNYLGSASNSVGETTVASGFAISATSNTLTIKSGSSGTLALTLTPTGNFQAAATFACSGLPAAAACSFSPSTVSFSGNNAAVTTQLTLATNVQSSALSPFARLQSGARLAGIILLPGLLFAGGIASRGKYFKGRWSLLITLMTIGGLLLAVGCGSSSRPTTTQSTPTGTYTVVVTANAVNGGAAVTQQFTSTVTVTQ
jgi:hypothetical protein